MLSNKKAEDLRYASRIVAGIQNGLSTRSELALFCGLSPERFTRIVGLAIVAGKVEVLPERCKFGGLRFGVSSAA